MPLTCTSVTLSNAPGGSRVEGAGGRAGPVVVGHGAGRLGILGVEARRTVVVEVQCADVDALPGERGLHPPAERVVADRAGESRRDAEAGEVHGDVGLGTADRYPQRLGGVESVTGFRAEHDERLADAEDERRRHGPASSAAATACSDKP